ncbi:hypothetical protein PVAND_009334 [Polypedilum vanderplanki]|uniref:Gustatory receptor n=1 Tax=Polypedilum vanderplanki TaxID=319348 RepID=A0A9J6CCF1_POLVA|nr:hypothetical protein PVAND_009334 [Polypedilum vanderplanki]
MMYKNFEIQFRKKLLEDKLRAKSLRSGTILDSKGSKLKSFHEILTPVILVGNIFSIFPVAGLFSKNVSNLKFRLWYPVTIYSLLMNFCMVSEFGLLFLFLYRAGFQFFMVGQTIFTFTCAFGSLYFFYLSTKWKSFMTIWHQHEKIFLLPPYSDKVKNTYVVKIWFVAIMTIALTIFDHYVYFVSQIENTAIKLESCEPTKQDFWRTLFVSERQVFFLVIPYYAFECPFLEWYEVVKQVSWTYSEVLVSCMSIALATRFKQLTNRLKFYEKHHLAESFWNEIREHYNIICNLVLKADEILSPIIIVYSFANMFFICQKIFMQFERKKLPWDRYYSFYSAVFLICRTMWMLFFGAGVNEESREVLKILREVPSETFDGINYHRLLDVVHSNSVAISGYRFFYVTKSMILALAGTILTYELVLVQQIDDIDVNHNATSNACGYMLI